MLKLRDYQEEALKVIARRYDEGVNRQLLSLATGAGKTVIFATMISEWKRPTLVLAHTNELLTQARDKIKMVAPGLDVGILNGQTKGLDHAVVVASIQSARQPETLAALQARDFSLLVADECHHFAAPGTRTVLELLGFSQDVEKLLVGFTATPFRSDGIGLGGIFDEVVFEKSVCSLIEGGYLVPPRGIRISTDLDLRGVAQNRGDYAGSALAAVMDTQEVRSLVFEAYQKHAMGRSTICFASSVQHARSLAEGFNSMGISAHCVHGGTPREERDKAIAGFKDGEIEVLTNCNVLTEGYDAPSTECVIVARPTRSRGLYQQMVGRGLRRFPGKSECLVLDFGDQAHTLCSTVILLPDAEGSHKREQSIKSREKDLKKSLPDSLNVNLKRAYVSANLLSEEFNWTRQGIGYVLRGAEGQELMVMASGENVYNVVFSSGGARKYLARDLSFEYAFGAAEDFARENRILFILADRDAAWRGSPITARQLELFRKRGFKNGIDRLTRGQASDLIGAGALRRRFN